MIKRSLFTLILITILGSCSDNSSNTINESTIQPKVGSKFTVEYYDTDTTTGKPISSSILKSVWTYSKTGTTYEGKTNVSEVNVVFSNSQTSSYFVNYESNNDLCISKTFLSSIVSVIKSWFYYPTSSKSPVTTVLYDTTIISSGVSESSKSQVTISFENNETLEINGKSINVMKFKSVHESIRVGGGITQSGTSIEYDYYAPSLGFMVKSETPVITTTDGYKSKGKVRIVTDFDLK